MSIAERFSKVKVLVVGDIMLDQYWWGSVNRISPEAPVPIVKLGHSSYAPGGAANVAVNVAGLGAEPILVGAIGNDLEADRLKAVLFEHGVSSNFLVRIDQRLTTVKTRVVAHSQHVVRIDQEETGALPVSNEDAVIETIEKMLPEVNAVIVSDYSKGLLSKRILKRLIQSTGSGKTVLVDPKGIDYSKYRGASVITPNRREAAEACGLAFDDPDLIEKAGLRMMNELKLSMVLITQSEDGMTVFESGKKPFRLHAAAKETYDVTGAGDTVIAGLGVALAAEFGFREAAQIANTSAGIVVEQVGTTAIEIRKLERALDATAFSTSR
ncbi:MAG: D-glycero-beta-D-manno-heptose-7-phosphate kinase [Blastocatellia bacterium]